MLRALGKHAAPHVGAIVERLHHANEDVRHAAMRALGALGKHAAPHGHLWNELHDLDTTR